MGVAFKSMSNDVAGIVAIRVSGKFDLDGGSSKSPPAYLASPPSCTGALGVAGSLEAMRRASVFRLNTIERSFCVTTLPGMITSTMSVYAIDTF